MEDFVFGTHATDTHKLIHHRVLNNGIHHAHRVTPRDPLPGQGVIVQVTIGPDIDIDEAACYFTLDGTIPSGSRGQASHGEAVALERVSVDWDTVSWGYVTTWQATFPGQPDGTVIKYCFSAWKSDGGEEIFADWPHVKNTLEMAARAYYANNSITMQDTLKGERESASIHTLHVDTYTPPQWAREAVIYHIFVDRFSPGNGDDWKQTSDQRGFFGGTLAGITEKLDYVAELGATALWLSPIFESPTVHGYDATGYKSVPDRLGNDAGLHRLVEEAHARGIRVILDLVCNHMSNRHPYFLEAQADSSSPYRDWFHWDDSEPGGYRSFFGHKRMPQINLDNTEARRWMLDIARYWLREFDVDGYRLDHAHGPGPDFWPDFWAACKDAKPDSFSFGEITEPPDLLAEYVGRLDGTLDFQVSDALRRTYAHQLWTEAEFSMFIERHYDFFPQDFLLPTFLDNHDMDRFIYIAGGSVDKLKRAAAVQMSLPQPPIIYYGTEVGLSHPDGVPRDFGLEISRAAMPWGSGQDAELLTFYRRIIRERQQTKPWLR